jgi:hypothetical protein
MNNSHHNVPLDIPVNKMNIRTFEYTGKISISMPRIRRSRFSHEQREKNVRGPKVLMKTILDAIGVNRSTAM